MTCDNGQRRGRPEGEVRQALSEAARQIAEENERNGATWRDMAERARVGYLEARRTVENMERCGQLQSVGAQKRAHSRRWMTLYAPPEPSFARPAAASADLAGVTRSWMRAR